MKSTWVGVLASIFINPNPQWNYDALPRPVGPYKWHSQFFELLSFLVYLRCTLNDIDSQAQVEHHSITGVWKGFFLGGNKSSVDTCMLISVYGHVFIDYKKTESFIAAKSLPLAPATIWTTQQGHRPGSSPGSSFSFGVIVGAIVGTMQLRCTWTSVAGVTSDKARRSWGVRNWFVGFLLYDVNLWLRHNTHVEDHLTLVKYLGLEEKPVDIRIFF